MSRRICRQRPGAPPNSRRCLRAATRRTLLRRRSVFAGARTTAATPDLASMRRGFPLSPRRRVRRRMEGRRFLQSVLSHASTLISNRRTRGDSVVVLSMNGKRRSVYRVCAASLMARQWPRVGDLLNANERLRLRPGRLVASPARDDHHDQPLMKHMMAAVGHELLIIRTASLRRVSHDADPTRPRLRAAFATAWPRSSGA